MDDIPTQNERLNKVVEPFRATKGKGINEAIFTAFDTTKSNFHDSKAEFLEEKQAVEMAVGNAQELFYFLMSGVWGEAGQHSAARRVASIIEEEGRARLKNHPVQEPSDVVRKSASEVGLPRVMTHLLYDLRFELWERLRELENQEKVYWSERSRPPNHYARTIALRFAKFIASESGQKPTIGTSRDGGHPSTDYGRALEDIFKILGIKGHFKRPGQWAIDQLTEVDLHPPKDSRDLLRGIDPKDEFFVPNLLEVIPGRRKKV